MILALTNKADFPWTIYEQYCGKNSYQVIQAYTGLLFAPMPYTGHFHTPVNHVYNPS